MNSPQPVKTGRAAGALRRLFELIDDPAPARCVELLAPDVRFSVVFSQGRREAQDFAGDRRAFEDYLAQRGAPSLDAPRARGVGAPRARKLGVHDVEIVLGETRQDGMPVASFVAAVRLAADGRIDRYVVGRSPAVLFDLA